MRWQGRRESDNVEDRRNSSGGPSMGGPGFRLPSGKGGLILLIVVLVAGYYGVDLTGLMTGQPVSQQQSTRSISPNEDKIHLGDSGNHGRHLGTAVREDG